MGFFKDFKDDFSQAVNELLPGDDFQEEDIQVNTLDSELDVETELSKLDGLLEQVERKANQQIVKEETKPVKPETAQTVEETQEVQAEPELEPERKELQVAEEKVPEVEATVEETKVEEEQPQAVVNETISTQMEDHLEVELNAMRKDHKEEFAMDTLDIEKELTQEIEAADTSVLDSDTNVTDEVSIITKGTSIKGNMDTTGSIEVQGKVEGDIKCNGKLTVTGTIAGNSSSSEFYADAAHIEGEVISSGTVKIGHGAVIIGNITATSAVIAGAVKGDIDVQGPVVVDTSAVIMGNIKSRSVQINNGAVIEGFCSQCYADIDVESLFG
ncbi:MAG: polymer-forming cytoskeletal protein [bacterium]|nr:polymer-forming cytoskeletal protein [bacterium]